MQITKGSTASITIKNDIVIKRVDNVTYAPYNVFERELFWLKRFKDVDFIPNLVDYDDVTKSLTLDYAGTRLTTMNRPKDIHSQFDDILSVLKAYNCSHNDINLRNILLLDSTIYLIDFGWSTFINDSIEDSSSEYFKFISSENNIKFPKVLNEVNRNRGILDDVYAFLKLKILI